MKIFNSPAITNPLEAARKRVAAAEKSVEAAKEESRNAKRKRKEAKLAARRAKKQLKRTKEELDDAQRALSQEEANDALRLKIVRASKRPAARKVRLSPPRTKAKRQRKSAKRSKSIASTPEPMEPDGTSADTVPVESIPAGDFQISQAASNTSSTNAGTEPVPQQNA